MLFHGLEIIDYDPEFWEDMEDVLNCLLPEIVDPRAPLGLPISEADHVFQVKLLR